MVERIQEAKRKRNAVILAHNYQRPEVQDIGDYVGDSLGLARQAARTEADVIVFCGVHFMAETASILCPQKIVLLPDLHAGCPMADMADARDVQRMKEQEAAIASEADEFVLATEAGMIHPLSKAIPHKRFYPPSHEPLCPNMKLITLSKVLQSLETLTPEVKVPESIRDRALMSVERMLVPR